MPKHLKRGGSKTRNEKKDKKSPTKGKKAKAEKSPIAEVGYTYHVKTKAEKAAEKAAAEKQAALDKIKKATVKKEKEKEKELAKQEKVECSVIKILFLPGSKKRIKP